MAKFVVPMLLMSTFVIGLLVLADVTKTDSASNEGSVISPHNRQLMNHNHPPLATDDWGMRPSIEVSIFEDKMMGGWNVKLDTEYFNFTPSKINTPSQKNTGHAHLYINGKKYARVYSNWFYVERLAPGKHKFSVTLNSNMHEELTFKGKKIEATGQLIQN